MELVYEVELLNLLLLLMLWHIYTSSHSRSYILVILQLLFVLNSICVAVFLCTLCLVPVYRSFTAPRDLWRRSQFTLRWNLVFAAARFPSAVECHSI